MKKLFGTDGIRGKANIYPITPEIGLRVGKAIAQYFGKKSPMGRPKAVIGKDPYTMALVANSLFQLKDSRAVDLMNDLLKMQGEDDFWEGTTRSVVNSSGINLKIETTAITTLAFLEGKKSGLSNHSYS